MAYKKTSLGLMEAILDSVNSGKRTGKKQKVTIEYAIDPGINNLLVPYSKGSDFQVLPNTAVTKAEFDIEVEESLRQWEGFINFLYAKYIDLSIKRNDKSEDLIIFVSPSDKDFPIQLTPNSISFKLGVAWASFRLKGDYYLSSYLVFAFGMHLGLQPTFETESPLTLTKLSLNFTKRFNLTTTKEGIYRGNGLIGSKELKSNVQLKYGHSELDIQAIYGNTDPHAEDYNPEATISNSSQASNVANPKIVHYYPMEYGITRSTVNDYILPELGEAYILDNSLLSAVTPVETSMSTSLEGGLLSSVSRNDAGIQRYTLQDSKGNLEIMNLAGELLSGIRDSNAIPFSEVAAYNEDLALAARHMIYPSLTSYAANSSVFSINTEGVMYHIGFDEDKHQLSDSLDTVYNCEDEDYEYGNLDDRSPVIFTFPASSGEGCNLHQLKVLGHVTGGYKDVAVEGASTTNIISYMEIDLTVGVINKRFAEFKVLSIVLSKGISSFFTIDLFSPYSLTLGSSGASKQSTYLANPLQADTSYDYYSLSDPSSASGAALYSPLEGFSFSGAALGLYSISQNKWSASSYKFSITPDTPIETIETIDLSNPSSAMLQHAELPIEFSPNYLEDLSSSSVTSRFAGFWDTLGKTNVNTLVAYAVRHGFILFRFNVFFGQLVPLGDGGHETHVPGGDLSMASSGGGYTPISMAFSPHSNFLYTILENPTDPSDRKIGIFNTSVPEGDVAGTAIIIDNPFAGSLSKVNLEKDGSIYFYSKGTSSYCKIPNPDLYQSVELFLLSPSVITAGNVFELLPSGGEVEVHPTGANPTSISPGSSILLNNNTFTGYGASSLGDLDLDNLTFSETPYGPALGPNDYWVASATEDHAQTGEKLFTAALTNTGSFAVYDREGTPIYQRTARTTSSASGAVFTVPLTSPLNSYAIGFRGTDKFEYVTVEFSVIDSEKDATSLDNLDMGVVSDAAPGALSSSGGTVGTGGISLRKGYYDYLFVSLSYTQASANARIKFTDMSRGLLGKDGAGAYLNPSVGAGVQVHTNVGLEGGPHATDLTTVIAANGNISSLVVCTSYMNSAVVSVGSLDHTTLTLDNIATLDISGHLTVSGAAYDGYRITSAEFTDTGAYLLVLIADPSLAVLGAGPLSKLVRIPINIDNDGIRTLGDLELVHPFALDPALYDSTNYTIPPGFTFTGDFPDVLNVKAFANTRPVSLFRTKQGRMCTVNGNSSEASPSIGVILNPEQTSVRLAVNALQILEDHVSVKVAGFSNHTNIGDPSKNGAFTGFVGPTDGDDDDDDVPDLIYGCTNYNWCDYNPAANVSTPCQEQRIGSCPCLEIQNSSDFAYMAMSSDDCGICNVQGIGTIDSNAFSDVGVGGGPISNLWGPHNVSEDYETTFPDYEWYSDADDGVVTTFNSYGYSTTLFYYNANDCKTCTSNDYSVINAIPNSDCIFPWCQPFESACEYGGCISDIACNGVTQVYADSNGIIHYEAFCEYAPTGCSCSGDTLTLDEGYCGDCSDPTSIVVVTGECGCDGSLPDGYCDCGATQPVNDYCGCGVDVFEGLSVCNCAGDLSDGPFCDCDGVYNETLYCNCDEEKQLYYFDSDGDGIGEGIVGSIANGGSGMLWCPEEVEEGWVTTTSGAPCGVVNCQGMCEDHCDYALWTTNSCGECVLVSAQDEDCCAASIESLYNGCSICPDSYNDGVPNSIGELEYIFQDDPYGVYRPYVQYTFLNSEGVVTVGLSCTCTGLDAENPNSFTPSEWDPCGECGGSVILGSTAGSASYVIDGVEYCSCSQTPLVGGCCDGYVMDCLTETCVVIGTETQTFPGCGCGEGPMGPCGCGPLQVPDGACNCAGDMPSGCDNVCGSTAEFDYCGVCEGTNDCAGCSDPYAINYAPDSPIFNNTTCEFLTLQEVIDDVIIDTSPTIVATSGVLMPNSGTMNLDYIVYVPTYPIAVLGETVLVDNAYWTEKCQIIGGSNCTFYVENPAANAEITYSVTGDFAIYGYYLVGEGGSPIDVSNNTQGDYWAHYFFRVLDTFELTTSNVAEIFAGQVGAINSISDSDGNVVQVLNGEFVSPEAVQIENGTYLEGGQEILNNYEDSTYPSFPGYNVYKVTPARDMNGNPHTFTVNFCAFLDGGFDPEEDCGGRSLPSNVGGKAIRAAVATEDEPLNSRITGVRIDLEVHTLGISNLDDVKWFVYSDTNGIVTQSETLLLADAVEGIITKSYSLSDVDGCAWFLPVGFTDNDVWKNVNLTINIECDPYHHLRFGYSETEFGSVLLKTMEGKCMLGCSSEAGLVTTEYCIAKVRKDVKEFTDIKLRVLTEESHLGDFYATTELYVYNLETGAVLASLDLEGGETSFVKSFRLDKDTRVGVYVNNPLGNSMTYSLISESGETILNKKIK